jgi:L-alanine-DL-glutamate epimerase-like enolase superfamily enzyme
MEERTIITKTMPQYIILKPSFIGGFRGTQEWISLAEKHHWMVDYVCFGE